MKYGHHLIIVYQYWRTGCDKYSILMGDVNNKGTWVYRSI